MRVVQGMLPLREHPPLLVAGQPAGEPGGEGAAADANARQGHGGQVQRVEGGGPPRHSPKELEVQDAPDEAADAAGGKEDHLVGRKER